MFYPLIFEHGYRVLLMLNPDV